MDYGHHTSKLHIDEMTTGQTNIIRNEKTLSQVRRS